MTWYLYFLCRPIVVADQLGSIPFAWCDQRRGAGRHRKQGSGNIGATNVPAPQRQQDTGRRDPLTARCPKGFVAVIAAV
jgi:glycerol-3-phosphate acyltransferase PlsY